MANLLTDILERIKIDYLEYRNFRISKWNVKRDHRLIRRAVRRAKEKNAGDGRTYYILKDKTGGINEFSRDDILFWTPRGMLPKMNYEQRLQNSLAIVTSNKKILNHYNQIQLKKEGKQDE